MIEKQLWDDWFTFVVELVKLIQEWFQRLFN